MKFKKFIKGTALALSFLMLQNSVVLAATYKDVPSSHYAYEAISRISDLGYLVGNMSGNFEPNGYLDKFLVVDILSKISGYKDTGASAEEKSFQDKAYEKHKAYLSLFSSKFARWNSVKDRQIAYLIEKEILDPEDLNMFVIVSQAGTEQLMAITREQAAVFLVKLLGKQDEAEAMKAPANPYSDDSTIDVDKKPFVYYMRSIGIMQGDQNIFSPRSAITKAAMAVLLDKVINQMNGTTPTGTPAPTSTPAPSTVSSEIVTGTITTIYDSYKAVQVTSNADEFNNKILKISATAEIVIDGYAKTFTDIKSGMTFSGLFSNGELVKVIAASVSTPTPTPTPTPTTTPTPTPTPTPKPTTPAEIITVEGIVTAIINDGYTKSFVLEIKLVNLRGEVYTEKRTFTLANDCQITKEGKAVDFVSIAKNDQAVVKASGNMNVAISIELEEKDKQFTGTLMAKKVLDTNGAIILTIEDSQKNSYDLRVVNADTVITKKGFGTVKWQDLRIGDTVEVKAEYDKLLEIYASGVKSTLDGTVEAVYISADESYVMLNTPEFATAEKYYVIPGSVDMYSLKIGSDIRVRLESREISAVTVLREVAATSVTGYVSYVTRSSIVLKQSTNSQVNTLDILYNSKTVFIDSKTGKTVTINEVNDNDSVYIVYTAADSKTAKTVTIFGN